MSSYEKKEINNNNNFLIHTEVNREEIHWQDGWFKIFENMYRMN